VKVASRSVILTLANLIPVTVLLLLQQSTIEVGDQPISVPLGDFT